MDQGIEVIERSKRDREVTKRDRKHGCTGNRNLGNTSGYSVV